MKNRRPAYDVVMVLLLLLCTSGCVPQNAMISRSYQVTNQFETYELRGDHAYYYSGTKIKPIAVVGIHKDYSLLERHWKPIVFTPQTLKKTIDMMKFQVGSEYKIDPNGAVIKGPGGRHVGIWYSVWRYSHVMVYNDRTVNISKPATIFPARKRRPPWD